jgi:multidrug efflux system membrane fusion protein
MKKAIASGLAALGMVTVFAGCGGGQKKAGPPPGLPVLVGTVTREDVPVEWSGVGTVEAIQSVSVRAQVTGALTEVRFKEGQEVKKGDLLFVLDERPFEAALRAAEAQLQRDRALLASARADAKRYAELVGKEYVTRSDADTKQAQAEALAATVAADEAGVSTAKVNLQYCRITAPLTGRTGSLLVKQGNVVKATDEPLVVIQQMQPIRAAFVLPQSFLGQLRARAAASTLTASAKAPEDPGPGHDGALTFIDNAVDPTTGTIAAKAEFQNQDRALWPGQFVNVRLVLDTDRGAVVAPTQAVQTGQSGDYVFVVKDDQTVEMRQIEVRRAAGDKTVVAKGLAPGDKVVVEGQLRLQPGVKVEVQQPSAKVAAS